MLKRHTDFKSAYERAEAYLLKAMENGRLPPALLIAGPEGSGRRELARSVSQKLLKTEPSKLDLVPDYFEIDCDPYQTDIDRIRALLAELRQRPFTEGSRAVVLKDAHLLKEQYQDTLLKTIEEPPKNTVFILTGNEAGLLPTILSRCVVIRLGIRDLKDIENMLRSHGATPEDAALYTRISGGVPGRALDLLTNGDKRKYRSIALDSLETVLSGRPNFELGTAVGKLKDATEDKGRGVAAFTLECILSYCRDLLLLMAGFEAEENIDRLNKFRLNAERFTSGKINSMIDSLLEAKGRLQRYADAERTLDRLFIDFTEVL